MVGPRLHCIARLLIAGEPDFTSVNQLFEIWLYIFLTGRILISACQIRLVLIHVGFQLFRDGAKTLMPVDLVNLHGFLARKANESVTPI